MPAPSPPFWFRRHAPVSWPLFYVFLVGTLVAESPAQRVTNVAALQEASRLWSARALADKQAAAAWAQEQGLPIRCTLSDGTVLELMSLEGGSPVYRLTCNIVAADTVSTDELWPAGSSGLNLDGTGALLGIWDAGQVRATHLEFEGTHLDGTDGRAVQRDGADWLNRHATHVAGTMIAGGADPLARGMSFAASLDCYDWNSDYAEMLAAAADGLLVSSHSYTTAHGWVPDYNASLWAWLGNQCVSIEEDHLFGFYSYQAHLADQLAYDAPYYLACWAAGNDRLRGPDYFHDPDLYPVIEHWARPCGSVNLVITDYIFNLNGWPEGYDCISDEAVAKNVLTVGAVRDLVGGYQGAPWVLTASFSSMGPTDDGRIKPDLSANGTGLLSSSSDADDAYASFSGTSMACPNVSGSLGLLIQHYRATHGGANMRAATLKALALHTADECGDYAGPDYMFGWGLLNTNKAAGRITNDVFDQNVIREETLLENGTFELPVQVDGTHPLRATICWTDPPGTPPGMSLDPTTPMLVNDLDLAIEAASGVFAYYPWVLNPFNPDGRALQGFNHRDNVEQVYVDWLVAGEYVVKVTHTGMLQDGSQDFSLILTTAPDCNGNGLDDEVEIAGQLCEDCDENGVPDDCDLDSDQDGAIDACEECPFDPFKVEPGVCGCGYPEDLTDSDGDETPDCIDECPADPAKTEPEFCGCGVPETDTDGDQAPDCVDECPYDPDKTSPEECGCGIPDTDTDSDQTPDCHDICHEDPYMLDPGQGGCGQADTDADGDQTADCVDDCPDDPAKAEPGLCGCGVEEQTDDPDGDAVIDCLDGCPDDGQKTAPGLCGCGRPDVDSDSDGALDCHEECPFDPLKTEPEYCGCGWPETDTDLDQTPDCVDLCALDPDKVVPGVCGCGFSDVDSDTDGVADCRDGCPLDPLKYEEGVCGCQVSDRDTDGDNTPDCIDGCPNDPDKATGGICGCGVSDADSDADGMVDCEDNCPAKYNPDQADTDGDGTGDACESAAAAVQKPPAATETDQVDEAPALTSGCGFGAGPAALTAFWCLCAVRVTRRRRR